MKRVVQIYIPSELGYEKIPISAVATVAQKMGFRPERIENLKMATGEAVTNAIEHGNQLNENAEVYISLTIETHELVVIVVDQGQKPIPTMPTERKHREDNRGWGMLLIRDLVDEVTVTAIPECNEVKMVAYLDK
jgi:serine/threonine-protein kinase RsbW